jgi:glycosyltransferase involved in cell wall biosynthesis
MSDAPLHRPRVAVYSMFCLADQFDLAAEFREMLITLSRTCDVLHLSMSGPRPKPEMPAGIQVEEYGLSVDRRNRADLSRKALLQFFHAPAIARRLRAFKPDVIYLPDIIPMFPMLLKFFSGCRVATSYGDWHIHNKLEKKWWAPPVVWLAGKLDRWEVSYVDCFTCRARAATEKLKGWGAKPDHLRMFHDAPDLSAFGPRDLSALRAKAGFKPDDIVLLYHGVMHQGKGIDQLIRWTAELRPELPGIGLLLVGAGPESEALRQLAREVKVDDRTHFTGWLETTHEVGDYCNAADICIAMRTGAESNVHIIPGALLHSMACRKVVLGPALPGVAEVIRPGENGYLFKADDGDSFKALIRDLAAHRADWPRVAGNAHREIVERFSIEATARQYAGALEHFARLPRG